MVEAGGVTSTDNSVQRATVKPPSSTRVRDACSQSVFATQCWPHTVQTFSVSLWLDWKWRTRNCRTKKI